MSKTRTIVALAACGQFLAGVGVTAEIPPHPDGIDFPALSYEPPDAAEYRYELPGGVPVYLAPDRELPLVDVVFTFKGGRYLDPPGKRGLASATATMMRRGGTDRHGPAQFDEEADYLAARLSTTPGATRSSASMNCLVSNFPESFALFMDMVRHPVFDGERLDLYKKEQIERMKQRNDHAAAILAREWRMLLYGEEHFEAALPTAATLASISREDLRLMHRRIFHPGNLVIAASGDFEPEWMLRQLAAAFEGWSPGPIAGDPPAPETALGPGVYHVEKDIPQGRLVMGLRSMRRDDPEYFPMLLANRILGGGGFTSRIVSRVRSDEGLAYSARSRFSPRVEYPGDFTAAFQSKNATVALAAKIIVEEIERLRSEPVRGGELQTAANALIETFPRRFESRSAMLGVFVDDELSGREPGYWRRYRDRVRGVTPQDIQRVARRYLVPDRMAILIVGPWGEIAGGDLEGRASMKDFFGGSVTHLPPRNPLTLE